MTFCKVVTEGGTAILSSRFNLSLPSWIAAKSSKAKRCFARSLASWNCWVSTALASGFWGCWRSSQAEVRTSCQRVSLSVKSQKETWCLLWGR